METIRSGWAPFKIQSCLRWVCLLSDRKKEQVHWLHWGAGSVCSHMFSGLASCCFLDFTKNSLVLSSWYHPMTVLLKTIYSFRKSKTVEKKPMKATSWLPPDSAFNTSYQSSSICFCGLIHHSNDIHRNCCVKGLSGSHS